jgi:hypothetical protein
MPIQLPQQQQFNVVKAGSALADRGQGGNVPLAQQQLALQKQVAGQQGQQAEQAQQAQALQADRQFNLEQVRINDERDYKKMVAGIQNKELEVKREKANLEMEITRNRAPQELALLGGSITAQAAATAAAVAVRKGEEFKLKMAEIEADEQQVSRTKAQILMQETRFKARKSGVSTGLVANAEIQIAKEHSKRRDDADILAEGARRSAVVGVDHDAIEARAAQRVEDMPEFQPDGVEARKAMGEATAFALKHGTSKIPNKLFPDEIDRRNTHAAALLQARKREVAQTLVAAEKGRLIEGNLEVRVLSALKVVDNYAGDEGKRMSPAQKLGEAMGIATVGFLAPSEGTAMGLLFPAAEALSSLPPGAAANMPAVEAFNAAMTALPEASAIKILGAIDGNATWASKQDPSVAGQLMAARDVISKTPAFTKARNWLAKEDPDLVKATRARYVAYLYNDGIMSPEADNKMLAEHSALYTKYALLRESKGRNDPATQAAYQAVVSFDTNIEKQLNALEQYRKEKSTVPAQKLYEGWQTSQQ